MSESPKKSNEQNNANKCEDPFRVFDPRDRTRIEQMTEWFGVITAIENILTLAWWKVYGIVLFSFTILFIFLELSNFTTLSLFCFSLAFFSLLNALTAGNLISTIKNQCSKYYNPEAPPILGIRVILLLAYWKRAALKSIKQLFLYRQYNNTKFTIHTSTILFTGFYLGNYAEALTFIIATTYILLIFPPLWSLGYVKRIITVVQTQSETISKRINSLIGKYFGDSSPKEKENNNEKSNTTVEKNNNTNIENSEKKNENNNNQKSNENNEQ